MGLLAQGAGGALARGPPTSENACQRHPIRRGTRECSRARKRRRVFMNPATPVRIPPILIAILASVPLSGLAAAAQVPDEARRQLQEALGAPFVVFREVVQDDMKLSDDQKKTLDDELQAQVQDAMEFFQK